MTHAELQQAGLTLTYSAEVLESDLLAQADDFTAAFRTDTMIRLLGRDVVNRIREAQRTIQQRLASPFSVMITGDFKRGKSTLINALVGEAIAPVDVRPETISINRIEYAEEFRARLQSDDGGEAILDREDLKRERLEPLLERVSSPVRHLRIGLPSPLLRSVTLIDTPGLGDLFRQFDQTVREYVEHADTIVYVLSSTSPLSETEREFLLSAIAPRHFLKVFFVVNASDVFASAEEESRLMNQVREKLNRLMPGASVYAISALDEWSRISGGARPRPARAEAIEQSFQVFRRDLEEAIEFRRRYYVLDRAGHAFSEILDLTEQRAAGLQAALQQNQEQLEAAVQGLEQLQQTSSKEFQAASEELTMGFDKLRREAEAWMVEFVDRVEYDVIPSLSSFKASQVRQHLPFFMKDRMRKAIEACVLAHEPEIASLMDVYARGVEAETAKAVQTLPAAGRAIPVAALGWSNLQTAELLAEFLNVGFLVQIGLAIFARKNNNAPSAQISESVLKSLPELREDVRARVREAYDSIRVKLVTAWTALHEQELQSRLGDMKQAMVLRDDTKERVEEAQAGLAEAHQLIEAKKRFAGQFASRVASNIEISVSAA